jgi:small conductance mechanosensitive channel
MFDLPTALPENYSDLLTQYGTRMLMAGLLTVGGYWLIKLALRAIGRLFTQQQVDRDVQPFLLSLLRIGLLVALVLSVLSTLGVETSSFIAVIGTAGLAVGLALQGSLANFAGGLLILAFKPFRVGDLIAVQGLTGYVEVVNLLNTVLVTDEHRTITIPNNTLTTNSITNYSRLETIRMESQIVVDRQYPVSQIRSIIERAVATCPQALPNPKPDVLVNKLTDAGIVFDVRVWCRIDAISSINYVVQEAITLAFQQEHIEGPRNEIDVLRFRSEG